MTDYVAISYHKYQDMQQRVGGGGGWFKGPRSPLPEAGVKDIWVVGSDVGVRNGEVHLPRLEPRVLALGHRQAAILIGR
jgi:hypothetical protein